MGNRPEVVEFGKKDSKEIMREKISGFLVSEKGRYPISEFFFENKKTESGFYPIDFFLFNQHLRFYRPESLFVKNDRVRKMMECYHFLRSDLVNHFSGPEFHRGLKPEDIVIIETITRLKLSEDKTKVCAAGKNGQGLKKEVNRSLVRFFSGILEDLTSFFYVLPADEHVRRTLVLATEGMTLKKMHSVITERSGGLKDDVYEEFRGRVFKYSRSFLEIPWHEVIKESGVSKTDNREEVPLYFRDRGIPDGLLRVLDHPSFTAFILESITKQIGQNISNLAILLMRELDCQ